MLAITNCFILAETLYRPTLQVAPSSDGVSISVTIQSPSPVVPSATIMDFQLIISASKSHFMVPVSVNLR